MSIDTNDEIIQDFLVEAGEIVEQLEQQLVSLESEPGDEELLNAVFRNFHTIKGGAGFLAFDPLVDICHQSENVFDVLRRGERTISADLMDCILQAFDIVQSMFEQLRDGVMPNKADVDLINRLEKFSHPGDGAQAESAIVQATVQESVQTSVQEPAPATASPAQQVATGHNPDAPITDEEFDALLDQLHGAATPGAAAASPEVTQPGESSPQGQVKTEDVKAKSNSDEITDDEFEAMLDQMQQEKKAALASPAVDTQARAQVPAPAGDTQASAAAVQGAAQSAKESTKEPENKPADKPPAPAIEAKAAVTEKKAATADTTVRVETGTLDRIMNMVGELVLLRNRLTNLNDEIGNEEMSSAVGNLDVVTAELQASVLKTRMQPIKKVFGRFPRVVRDVARSMNKQVVLKTTGEETDLDKNLVEALTDPLIHLVRNAVDHGIETPEVRVAAGKSAEGTIHLSAEQEGDHILLKISDDGAGMDADRLRSKVVEGGLMDADAAARLSDRDCYHLIFLPGLSTKEQVSDISGRGVGMDVVKSKINQLNGTILIDSAPGKGSVISIKVPLTLAIMPTLMVELGELEQIFALPLVNVNEILDLDAHKINIVDGRRVLLVRGKPLPLFQLNRWLTKSPNGEGVSGHVVVVTVGTTPIGLLVDRLLGREEVVIKPLGALLQGTKGLTGATVTGNGKIALILDLPGLIQSYSHLRQ